jgi:DNA polymerase-3 subunit delta
VPIHVLYGVDELARSRRLAALKEEADGGTGMLLSNLNELDGRDAKVADIVNVVMAAPFLAPMRMVVVDNMVDRFRPEPGRTGRRGFGPLDELFPRLESGLPPSTMLVFTGGGRDRNGRPPTGKNPFVERLREIAGAVVEQFDELKGKDLVRFVREEAAARGVRFRTGRSARPMDPSEEWLRPRETDPAELLANLHQGDTLSLLNEIQKLALYSLGADVTVDDVDLLCAGERQSEVWDFTDAVLDGDPARAFSAMAYLERHRGYEPGTLVYRLADAYSKLAVAGEMAREGAAPEEIGKQIRVFHPFPRDKVIARAKRYGLPGITAAYDLILEAERTKKQGEVDEDAGMHILISRLCTLAMNRATTGRAPRPAPARPR